MHFVRAPPSSLVSRNGRGIMENNDLIDATIVLDSGPFDIDVVLLKMDCL